MRVRFLWLFVFLACFSACPADAQAALFATPVWHTGQQWRVQAPQQVGNLSARGGQITDSETRFTLYRFTVLGRRTLRFEQQDGHTHIGQAVPPETCWLVTVAAEGDSAATPPYHCYFRVSDLSLREIYEAGRKGRGGYFIYSTSQANDDSEVKPTLKNIREPYRASIGPLLLDWPCFPLMARSATETGRISQSVTPEGGGVRVVLQSGTESTAQVWMPGDPWWRRAERDGRQKSRLLTGADKPFVGRQGKLGL